MKSRYILISLTFFSLTAAPMTLILSGCKSNGSSHAGGNEDVGSESNNPLVPRSFGPNYKYSELLTKDYDEMSEMVQSLINKAHTSTTREDTGGEAQAVEYLGRALKLIFSRPDSDNMVAKLVSDVRRELQGFNAYGDVIAGLVNEALMNLENKDTTVNTQATALVELENILGEIKPAVRGGNQELRRVVVHIKNADVRISDEVKRDRRMRGMFLTKNPSDESKTFLKSLETKKK